MVSGKLVAKNKVSKFHKNQFEFDEKLEQKEKFVKKHQDKALCRALKQEQEVLDDFYDTK